MINHTQTYPATPQNHTFDDDLDYEDDEHQDRIHDDRVEQQDGCLFPDRCLCVGDHTTSECITAEMADAYYQEMHATDIS